MLSLRPLAARLRRKMGLPSPIASAVEQQVLAPGFTSDRPAAISLAGEFDRAVGFRLSRDSERARVQGGKRAEGETVGYRLKDALVAHGVVYAGGTSDIYRNDGPRFVITDKPRRLAAGLLATSKTAELYFGDWLIESFSIALLSNRLNAAPVAFARQPWLHQLGYQDLLDLTPEPIKAAQFDNLWVVDDRGMNPDRGRRGAELRRRVRARASLFGGGAAKVFLSRGRLGASREINNIDEVEVSLQRQGYAIVHPEDETASSLAAKLSGAHIVVTTEGSAQMHAVLAMRDYGTLVILQPPLHFTAPGKDMTDWLGLDYAFLVGDREEGGFRIDVHRLDALLRLVDGK